MTNFDSITVDMLDTVTGGYHDPPDPTPAPQGAPGCKVGEPHPQPQKGLLDRLKEYGRQLGPWIRL